MTSDDKTRAHKHMSGTGFICLSNYHYSIVVLRRMRYKGVPRLIYRTMGIGL